VQLKSRLAKPILGDGSNLISDFFGVGVGASTPLTFSLREHWIPMLAFLIFDLL
jgi:hypothetical protein